MSVIVDWRFTGSLCLSPARKQFQSNCNEHGSVSVLNREIQSVAFLKSLDGPEPTGTHITWQQLHVPLKPQNEEKV